MNRISLSICFCWLATSVVLAQESTSLNGRWEATYQGAGGGDNAAELSISDTGGTWTHRAGKGNKRAKNKPCVDRAFPISILSKSAAEIAFEVNASTVLQGCPDLSVVAKLVDGKTLEGSFKNGNPIKFVRQ
ncbi:MAG: hypothetical protein IPJ08_24160 [Burkholderiales bacterium]|nr:hypothetical protein [Burkholderiales bacterium]